MESKTQFKIHDTQEIKLVPTLNSAEEEDGLDQILQTLLHRHLKQISSTRQIEMVVETRRLPIRQSCTRF
jgi:hypothetical protein